MIFTVIEKKHLTTRLCSTVQEYILNENNIEQHTGTVRYRTGTVSGPERLIFLFSKTTVQKLLKLHYR